MTHEWIPEAVRVIAETVEYGKPIGERLLALEAVWEQLARRAEELDDRRLLSNLSGLPRCRVAAAMAGGHMGHRHPGRFSARSGLGRVVSWTKTLPTLSRSLPISLRKKPIL